MLPAAPWWPMQHAHSGTATFGKTGAIVKLLMSLHSGGLVVACKNGRLAEVSMISSSQQGHVTTASSACSVCDSSEAALARNMPHSNSEKRSGLLLGETCVPSSRMPSL
jgi:hypothetical protein